MSQVCLEINKASSAKLCLPHKIFGALCTDRPASFIYFDKCSTSSTYHENVVVVKAEKVCDKLVLEAPFNFIFTS